MKRLVVLAAAAVGAAVVRQRLKAQQAEQELWSQITDAPAASTSGTRTA